MFIAYQGLPIQRLAHLVELNDIITVVDESTSTIVINNTVVAFKHYEPVMAGDFIVYLTPDDIYHCNAKVFAERNVLEVIDAVPFSHIQALLDTVTYQFSRVGYTTVTGCWAFLPNGFKIAYGESACVNPANFDAELGKKYAKERAEYAATQELWKLEGYLLKTTGALSEVQVL